MSWKWKNISMIFYWTRNGWIYQMSFQWIFSGKSHFTTFTFEWLCISGMYAKMHLVITFFCEFPTTFNTYIIFNTTALLVMCCSLFTLLFFTTIRTCITRSNSSHIIHFKISNKPPNVTLRIHPIRFFWSIITLNNTSSIIFFIVFALMFLVSSLFPFLLGSSSLWSSFSFLFLVCYILFRWCHKQQKWRRWHTNNLTCSTALSRLSTLLVPFIGILFTSLYSSSSFLSLWFVASVVFGPSYFLRLFFGGLVCSG